jgi:CDP-paratose 2-epimerase
MKKMLVTGSGGLIGSEVCRYFDARDWEILGVDNNGRAEFFGEMGDTSWNTRNLEDSLSHYTHYDVDIRDRQKVLELIETIVPDVIVHAAAQPSHDLAAAMPFEDFDTNAVGTFNLLQATRQFAADATFVHMSTNKVYGDRPNLLPLVEKETRWDYGDSKDFDGIKETFSIDQSKHSLFGASKVAADIAVQEYGRYFDMATCCLRGGCLTGPNHSGVELHGFLSYLVRCNVERRKYTVFGYKGKQVRDNIHSYDVARFIDEFIKVPRVAAVYNLGGGRQNSCSILEAFEIVSGLSGVPMEYEVSDVAREGDHICYISDLSRMKEDYPDWQVSKSLQSIFEEIYESWDRRLQL